MKERVLPVLRRIYYSRVLIWVLLGYGIVTRLLQYLSNRSIWFDESLLVMNILERGYLELLSPLDNVQAAPPLYLLLTKLLTELFGYSEYILRLIPLLSGIAALFLFVKMAERFLGPKALPPALALLVLADRAIYYSNEAKQYSLELLITIVILLLAENLYRRRYALRETIIFTIAGSLAIWCAYSSVFILAGTGIVLFIFALREQKEKITAVMAKLGTMALFWGVSFAISYHYIAGPASNNGAFYIFFENDFIPFPPVSLSQLAWYPQAAIKLFCNPLGFSIPHAALLLVIITAGVAMLWKSRKERFVLGLILLPLAVLATLSAMRFYPIADRMVLFTMPLFYLVIGEGLYHVGAALFRRSAVTAVVLAIVIFSIPALRSAYHLVKPRLNEESRTVIEYYFDNKQAGDEIYVYHESFKVFEYYTYNQEVSYIPGGNYRGNRQLYLDELDEMVGKGRIWFFFSHVVPGEGEMFTGHLDQIGEVLDFYCSQNAFIYLYDLGGKDRELSGGQKLVPGEYSSIQKAIEASLNGERIIVSPGIYVENIDFMGKEVAVQSSDPDDPEVVSHTIIQGAGERSVVSFCNGEGEGALLAGFTITGGQGTVVEEFMGCFGGGILVAKGSSPVISNNIIENNTTDSGGGKVPGYGGGVAVLEAAPHLIANTIAGNSALIEGGGICCILADPDVEGNRIEANEAKMGGGMAVSLGGKPSILDNYIFKNKAVHGGGINIVAASPVLTGNTIEGNIAEVYGGGISAWRSVLEISGNLFKGNTAGVRGGGMALARDAALSPFALFKNSFKKNYPDRIFYQPADYS
ncbi:MAG: hypothetical protein GX878_09075 [Firmicutes bacterium]|nr:hypothetical protein [Bacillota bacterium]